MMARQLCTSLLLALAGCAEITPVNAPSAPMTSAEARHVIMTLADGNCRFIDPRHNEPLTSVHAAPRVFGLNDVPHRYTEIGSTHISVNDPVVGYWYFYAYRDGRPGDLLMGLAIGKGEEGRQRARRVADAFLTLREANTPAGRAREYARLRQAGEAHRAAGTTPEEMEVMRRSEVQAEAATRDKQFAEAATIYVAALDTAPWWAQGHFNLALLAEALGDYDTAVDEMQRYVALAPGAPNVRAAQDKIYEWQARLPR